LSPSGFRWQRYDEPALTQIQPAVTPGRTVRYGDHEDHQLPAREPDGPEHPGGDWANPNAYLSYDDVDSRSIIDRGAPE
jgi:hypothetical protein